MTRGAEIQGPEPDSFTITRMITDTNILDQYRSINEGFLRTTISHEKMQRRHIDKSRMRIKRSADIALRQSTTDTPEALIFGLGNSIDVPLKDLAEVFRKIKIVDLDEKAVVAAVRKLPTKLQEKIDVVIADVSGITEEYNQVIQVASTEPKADKFLEKVTQGLQDIDTDAEAPSFGTNYTFVCSQLVMTELGSIPFKSLYEKSREHGITLPSQPNSLEHQLTLEARHLTRSMQQSHIEALAHAVAPSGSGSGIVHLADTSTIRSEGRRSTLLQPVIINPSIIKNFNKRATESWLWRCAPGLAYDVTALALEPKQLVAA